MSLITMLPIWSRSWASEVMVVVAVATFSTVLLHMSRSSSQSASPAPPHGSTRKPGGAGEDCTPSISLIQVQVHTWVRMHMCGDVCTRVRIHMWGGGCAHMGKNTRVGDVDGL